MFLYHQYRYKKMSLSKKGKPAWNSGKKTGPLSEEHKTKIKEANSGRIFSEEHKQKLRKPKKAKDYSNYGK